MSKDIVGKRVRTLKEAKSQLTEIYNNHLSKNTIGG